jgi:hypothetical protein
MVEEHIIHFLVMVRASDSGTIDFVFGHGKNCYSHPIASAHRQLGRKWVVPLYWPYCELFDLVACFLMAQINTNEY